MNNDPVFIICTNDGSGTYPVYETTDDRIAVMWFRTKEKAVAFINGKSRSREWMVREYNSADALKWLHNAAKRDNAADIIVDPSPDDTTAAAAPISTVLATLA